MEVDKWTAINRVKVSYLKREKGYKRFETSIRLLEKKKVDL